MPRPTLPAPASFLAQFVVAAVLASGCGPSSSEAVPRKVEPTASADGRPGEPTTTLQAAGVELSLPSGWTVLGEDEANFALASAADRRTAQIPVCTIELRRQGLGTPPAGAKPVGEREGLFEYQRGALRGRYRALPGPDGSAVVVHCRGPRSSTRWREIVEATAADLQVDPALALPAPFTPTPDSVVELCSGAQARVGLVCARRHGGSVHCGRTTGDTLDPVALPEPATQISCVGASACARLGTGDVHCWTADDRQAQPLAGAAGARDITGALVVTGDGKLVRRTDVGLVELVPHGDPALALTEVEQVLPGSTEAQGCVLRAGGLWCWAEGAAPELRVELSGASDLRLMGERTCAAIDGGWRCLDADDRAYTVAGCEQRPCGCSLLGASHYSCEDAPYPPNEARPLGRVDEVVAVAEPCVALRDGTVVCRGPAPGQGKSRRVEPAGGRVEGPVATDAPGLAHTLTLR